MNEICYIASSWNSWRTIIQNVWRLQPGSACKCWFKIDRKLHSKSENKSWKELNLWFKQIPPWNGRIPVDLGFNVIEYVIIDRKHTYNKWILRLFHSRKSQSNSRHATNTKQKWNLRTPVNLDIYQIAQAELDKSHTCSKWNLFRSLILSSKISRPINGKTMKLCRLSTYNETYMKSKNSNKLQN